jgi:hypothetical protein
MLIEAQIPNYSALSTPIELRVNLPGVVGYSVYQLGDESLVLNSVNQTCTFLTKLTPNYHLLWTQTIQIGQNSTALPRLLALRDGGFLLAGIVDNLYTLVKTDSHGNIEWTKTYSSGAPVNYFMSIIESSDGWFALAGFGEPSEDSLGWIWFAITDSAGNIQWDENISGPNADCPSRIIQTSDGGYVLAGTSYSFVPNRAFYRLIQMGADGHVRLNSTYGGYGYYYQPECNFAITTDEGGYLMAGYLWQKPAWIVKTDVDGNMQWNQTYGTNGCAITCALQTPKGYLLVDYLNQNHTGIILTDNVGQSIWNTTLSDVTLPVGLEANFNTIVDAKGGGYIMVASKNQSVWLAKLYYPKTSSVLFEALGVSELLLAGAIIVTFVGWRKK